MKTAIELALAVFLFLPATVGAQDAPLTAQKLGDDHMARLESCWAKGSSSRREMANCDEAEQTRLDAVVEAAFQQVLGRVSDARAARLRKEQARWADAALRKCDPYGSFLEDKQIVGRSCWASKKIERIEALNRIHR